MDAQLTAGQTAAFAARGKDRFGNLVPLTGEDAVQFAVDDATLLSLTDNGDGSGSVTSLGPTGATMLRVTDVQTDGDVVLGAGAVVVSAGELTVLDLEFQSPTGP